MASYLQQGVFSLNQLDTDQELRDRVHERILARCSSDGNCSIYEGNWDADGTPKIKVGVRTYSLVRVVAWLYKGLELWSPSAPVHTCRSPACANQDHVIILASRTEAMNYLRAKSIGRGRKRLNADRAHGIRSQYATGNHSIDSLAVSENVSRKAIWEVLCGRTYPNQHP